MGADLQLDPRLPALLEIEEPNRQQVRRAERGQAKCSKCRGRCPADNVCFADGQDAHRSCAEIFNHEAFNAWDRLRAQDLEDQFADAPRALGPDSINSRILTSADVLPLEEKYIDG